MTTIASTTPKEAAAEEEAAGTRITQEKQVQVPLPPVHEGEARLRPLTTSYFHASQPLPAACVGSSGPGGGGGSGRIPCILGIDEAGRGPVLGPMVYATCFVPASRREDLADMGFRDSKVLNEEERESLLQRLLEAHPWIGWSVYVHSPQDISGRMLQRQKYNLNEMAHNSTIQLIQQAVDAGVHLTEIYIDTVGPPEAYQAKLLALFPNIAITVAKKADSLYPVVSAASIVAKTSRDYILRHWQPVERGLDRTQPFGSGYPADPNTAVWMREAMDPVFGFPRIMRFSWSTCDKHLEKHGAAPVTWESDVLRDRALQEAEGPSIRNYFQPATPSAAKRPRDEQQEDQQPTKPVRHQAGAFLVKLGMRAWPAPGGAR